jgi:predicted esterase
MEGKYREAYEYITERSENVKGNLAQIYNFRYSIGCKAGYLDKAMEIFEEAIIDKGYWYSYDYLNKDEDLEPLRQKNRFNELAKICKMREEDARKNSVPQLKLIKANSINNTDKQPLLIALHGNQENITITKNYWMPAINRQFLLALPQSSQVEFSDAYSWDDIGKGTSELKEHYNKILSTNNIDKDNILIGGFSAGARIALNSILKSYIKVKGCIFVAPWLPEIDEWEQLFSSSELKNIKFHVICGNKDDDCLDCTLSFVDILKNNNIPHSFTLVKNLNHDYPESFQSDLLNIIDSF